MGQTEDPSPKRPDSGDEQGDRKEVDNLEPDPHWPLGTTSGPIKGFCANHVMENLNPLVCDAWEKETREAIFIHYLDGGYNPDVTQNVHTITKDLRSKHHLKTVDTQKLLTDAKQKSTPRSTKALVKLSPLWCTQLPRRQCCITVMQHPSSSWSLDSH